MGDDKDRQRLDQMTEKEREMELYNRQERLEAMKIRKELGQKLQAERKKQSKKKDKEKKHKSREKDDSEEEAGEIKDDDDDQYSNTIASRKSERKKGGDDSKKTALDELKQKRTEKKEKEKMEQSKKELLKTTDVWSDDDDDDKGRFTLFHFLTSRDPKVSTMDDRRVTKIEQICCNVCNTSVILQSTLNMLVMMMLLMVHFLYSK